MTELSSEDLQAIIQRRDRRYDGRFYFGVKTTKIYCRPVCPAKRKAEHIVLLRSRSEAERLGYRPCKRCRPDASPDSKYLAGTLNTVARALRIIHDSSDGELSIDALAQSLGISTRHLRRLFDSHLGASPGEIMTTKRLHFAKQLLHETSLPMTEVAYSAGFQSLRRFNEAFKSCYQEPPSHFRQQRSTSKQAVILLNLAIHLPYDWPGVLHYLRRHEAYGIELIDDRCYRRFIGSGDGFGTVAVTHDGTSPKLQVELTGLPINAIRFIMARLRVLFDSDHNPVDLPYYAAIAGGGVRVPASFDPFETAVAIVLGQLVSTQQAKQTLRKLIVRWGRLLGAYQNQPVYAFPAPTVLADCPIEEIGIPRTRAAAIRGLAAAVASRSVDFAAHGEFAAVTDVLLSIKGIGPWTAAMIAMRCLGDPDAFPTADLIVRRALEQKLVEPSAWGSARAYLTHCLWRDYAEVLSLAKKPRPPTKGAKS